MKTEKYDVLIIGGGLVGASLLCALEPSIREHGLRVALVESHDIDEPRDVPPSYDARASALSYGTRLIYESLGLWGELSESATAIEDIHVSDRGHFGVTRLNAVEQGVSALGYVVENFRIGEVLLQRLKQYRDEKRVDVFTPARVERLTPLPGSAMKVDVHHENNLVELEAGLVVLADGGRSSLMDQLCIFRKQYDYQQHALICNLSLNQSHNGMAWERFAGDGPMALLPLSGDRCALVWTLPSNDIERYLEMDDNGFLKTVQDSFGNGAGRFTRIGKRDSYPLSLSVAREQVRPGLVILGNAAHAMHPVAGQGYNLAIRDALALSENIKESLESDVAPGNLTRLLTYVDKQRKDQATTLGFCDALVKLFARREPSVVVARNLGLLGMDMSRTLKGAFARKAMGL